MDNPAPAVKSSCNVLTLPSGLRLSNVAFCWQTSTSPLRLWAAEIVLDARDMEDSSRYKVRAAGCKPPVLRSLVRAVEGEGTVCRGEFKNIVVFVPDDCIKTVRLSIVLDKIEIPIVVKKSEGADGFLWSDRPSKHTIEHDPTPRKTPLRTIISLSSARPTPARVASGPSSTSRALLFEPLSCEKSKTPVAEDPINNEQLLRLRTLILSRKEPMTYEILWSIVHWSVMETFVSAGRYAREWFMGNASQWTHPPTNRGKSDAIKAPSFDDLIVDALIEMLEADSNEVEECKEEMANEEKSLQVETGPGNPIQKEDDLPVDWFKHI